MGGGGVVRAGWGEGEIIPDLSFRWGERRGEGGERRRWAARRRRRRSGQRSGRWVGWGGVDRFRERGVGCLGEVGGRVLKVVRARCLCKIIILFETQFPVVLCNCIRGKVSRLGFPKVKDVNLDPVLREKCTMQGMMIMHAICIDRCRQTGWQVSK